jgi:hypothetical protein
MNGKSELPTWSEIAEGLDFYPVALVVSATIFPGFALCIPGLLFVTVIVIIPLVAVGLVLGAVAAVVLAAVALVRAVRAVPGYVTAPSRPWNRGMAAPASSAQ